MDIFSAQCGLCGQKGVLFSMTMEVFKDYARFKEKCLNFSKRFADTYFGENCPVCHPTVENMIFVACSEEEARSNAIYIARMSDMLLQSDIGIDWDTFNLQEARRIAAENGHVYLTDLLYEDAFFAENWMINGKNDTVVISEEYMREKGKMYAPVTPLTNKVLCFKKIYNSFFWEKADPSKLLVLNKEYIGSKLEKYAADTAAAMPSLTAAGNAEINAFGGKITIDKNDARQEVVNKIFAALNDAVSTMKDNLTIIYAAGYSFSMVEYLSDILAKYLTKEGISVSKESFMSVYCLPLTAKLDDENVKKQLDVIDVRSEDEDVDCVKLAFLRYLEKEGGIGFEYVNHDADEYRNKLRNVECIPLSEKDEEKEALAALLGERPCNPAVFNLAMARFPEEDITPICEFWGIQPLSQDEVRDYVSREYFADALTDGEITAGYDKAAIILSVLKPVSDKYGLGETDEVKRLERYIDMMDRERRTYNGTVFDTVEDMKKAAKNEADVAELCTDLSAMTSKELSDLRAYIRSMPLDNHTAAKYLVKIKVAMNNSEKNTLSQMCLKLPFMTEAEINNLCEKIGAMDCDEYIKKPFLKKAEDYKVSAQRDALTEMCRDADKLDGNAVSALAEKIRSGGYDKVLSRHFLRKLDNIGENSIRSDIAALCEGMESMANDQLEKLRNAISEKKYPNKYVAKVLRSIDSLENRNLLAEIREVFSGIEEAGREKIDELKKIISENKYDEMLISKYSEPIRLREIALNDADLDKKLEDIADMDNGGLAEIREIINSGNCSEEASENARKLVEEREYDIVSDELAEICSNISEMTSEQLEKIKEALFSGRYPAEMTGDYIAEVAQRERELLDLELAELCENVSEMTSEQLENLKLNLSSDRYAPEQTEEYLAKVETRERELQSLELVELCAEIGDMNQDQLDLLRMRLESGRYAPDLIAPYENKIDKRESEILVEQLAEKFENIDSMTRDDVNKLRPVVNDGDYAPEVVEKYLSMLDKREKDILDKEFADTVGDISDMDIAALAEAKNRIAENPEFSSADGYDDMLAKIDGRIAELKKAELDKLVGSVGELDLDGIKKFKEDIEAKKSEMSDEEYAACMEKADQQANALRLKELEGICTGYSDFDLARSEEALEKVRGCGFDEAVSEPFIEQLTAHITELHSNYLFSLVSDIDNMSRDQLNDALGKINAYGSNCPEELKKKYSDKVTAKLHEIEDKELQGVCGNLSALNLKQTNDLKVKIDTMDIDREAKNRYLDAIDEHIIMLKSVEADGYVDQLIKIMENNNISNVQFHVPRLSKVFDLKFGDVCKKYVSPGRYEIPMLIHESKAGVADDGFTITSEYLYYKFAQGKFDRIPLENIVEFIPKKTLFGQPTIELKEKDGKTYDIPCGIAKANIDNAAKVLTLFISYIKQERAAAKFAEIQEAAEAEKHNQNVVSEPVPAEESAETKQEATAEEPAAEPVPEVKEAEAAAPEAAEEKPAETEKAEETEEKPAEAEEAEEAEEASEPEESSEEAEKAEDKPEEAEKLAETDEVKEEAAEKTEYKPEHTPKKRFCEECGAPILKPTAKFCMECGHKLS